MVVHAYLLGVPTLALGAAERLEFPVGKSAALLLHLAYRGGWVARDELLYLFWPDTPERPAQANLRQTLKTVRAWPHAEGLEAEKTRLRWPVPTDVRAFRRALADGRPEEAVALYRGELLEGFRLPQGSEFENWLASERRELHSTYREAALALVEVLEGSGRAPQAAELLAQVHKRDPLDEEVLQRYLRSLHASGQRGKALKCFDHFRRTLQLELSTEPERATLALVESIRRETAGTRGVSVQVLTPLAPRHNLPLQATPFIGREGEKARLAELLSHPDARLLTVVGTGGIGKTRLVLEVARANLDAFRDGVCFVPLALVASPRFVVSAVAGALGFTFYGTRKPREQLLEYLRSKEMLLVLDNFEHLLEAAPLVSELLSGCPGVKALATSRTPLHLYGEREYSLSPLRYPEPKEEPERLGDYEAVRLFVERAQRVDDTFALTPGNARAVVDICARLDGLPLAIELAASRVKLFSPQELVARLDRRLGLLTEGASDLPERQRTLRDTIDWSYRLLSDEEKELFQRIGVFVGGFSLEAAEAMVHDLSLNITDGVATLVDKSLLRQTGSDEGRFVMLETLREYALEKLSINAHETETHKRHAEYFLNLAKKAEPLLASSKRDGWLRRLRRDHANLRAAFQWSSLHEEGRELGLSAASALHYYWHFSGRVAEGRRLTEDVLRWSGNPTETQAKAASSAGALAWMQGDFPEAIRFYEHSIDVWQGLKNSSGLAGALAGLATVWLYEGDLDRARVLFERSERLLRRADERWQLALTLNGLGLTLNAQGNGSAAQSVLEECHALFSGVNDSWGVSLSMVSLGYVACQRGDADRASALFEKALAVRRHSGTPWDLAEVLNLLGEMAERNDDHRRATDCYVESLHLNLAVGDRLMVFVLLQNLARTARAQHKPVCAVHLLAAAERLGDDLTGMPPTTFLKREDLEEHIAETRRSCGEGLFAAAWENARSLTLEQIVAYALDELAIRGGRAR